MNKLSQLREAAEGALDEMALFHMDDPDTRCAERLADLVVANPETIIALLDALEGAEGALTPWLTGEVPLAPTTNAERALALIAALKGES